MTNMYAFVQALLNDQIKPSAVKDEFKPILISLLKTVQHKKVDFGGPSMQAELQKIESIIQELSLSCAGAEANEDGWPESGVAREEYAD